MSQFSVRAVHPRFLPATLACGAVVGLGLAGAGAASAAAFEQVSRGNGANGTALFSNTSQPVFASDAGRFAIFASVPFVYPDRTVSAFTRLRDIVANTTRTIGQPLTGAGGQTTGVRYGRSEQIAGLTTDERTLLVRSSLPATPGGDRYGFYLRPTDGSGPDRLVASINASDERYNAGAISGDGSTVVVDDTGRYPDREDESLQVVTVATGAIRKYPEINDVRLGANSISDDGRVIAGYIPFRGDDHGFQIVNGVSTLLPDAAKVSADGSTVVTWGPDRATVIARNVAAGTQRSFPVPAGGVGNIIWVSPNGTRVAFAPGAAGGNAQALGLTSGTWSKFGTAFSASLNQNSAISRSGRYAVVEYGVKTVDFGRPASQAALVDLTGADLPGAQEGLSASSYLQVSPPVANSRSGDVITASFGRPAPWAPLPRRGELTITVDGTQTFHQTFTAPTTSDLKIPFNPAAGSVRTQVKVVDYLGRTIETDQTIAVRRFFDEP